MAQIETRSFLDPNWVLRLADSIHGRMTSGVGVFLAHRLGRRRTASPDDGRSDNRGSRRERRPCFICLLMPFAMGLAATMTVLAIRRFGGRLRAENILRERYARGEIVDERYEKMRQELEA
jgi:hypothetical protein